VRADGRWMQCRHYKGRGQLEFKESHRAEMVEVGCDLRSTNSKNRNQSNLLVFRHLEILQDKDWQKENNEIRSNVNAAVRKIQSPFVHAMPTGDGYIPEIGYRCAGERARKKRFDTICNNQCHGCIDCLAYGAWRAYAEVLQED
jgi:hypothetical protein